MDSLRGNAQLIAWAAGLYEGEGSCSAYLPKGRKTYRRQMAVSQGGDPGKPPLVLLGFRSAVVGAGNITGPYRDYLFYWKTTQISVIENIATSLWPFLSHEKRDQYLRASQMIGRPSSLELATPRSESVETESAWAAGFFDGEGTAGVAGSSHGGHGYRQPSMEIPQSSNRGIPDSLLRFQLAVGAGSITGPHPPRNPWARIPSYRWELGGHRKVETVAGILWPWLGSVKRSQIEWALSIVHAGLVRGAHKSAADRDA
jgi:hypothetical protein